MKKFFIITILLLFAVPAQALQQQENTDSTLEYLNASWWENYKDDNLMEHLVNLYEKNYDLKNSALKIKESEKLVRMQFANELPFIGFSGDLNRDLRESSQQFGNMQIPAYSQYNYTLPLTAGYEIDIWGKNRLKTKSLQMQHEMIKEAQRATYISLTSNFASDYFNLIKADKLLEIQNELIEIQEKILRMTQDKYKIGLCGINEVLFQEKYLTTLKEEKNRHQLTKSLLEETLKVYLSKNDGDIKRNRYENISLIEGLPAEYPSVIIENRPDFKQQEANIKKIGFDVKIAKKELLPNFTIVGQLGLNAYRLGSLFNQSSQFFNLGILPSFDVFSGGRKLALLKLKKYQYDRALNDYQKTILDDIKELNSAVYTYNSANDSYNESKNRLNTQTKIYSLAEDKNKIGASADIDVLFAKEAYLLVQKEEVSNKINLLISSIGIYKASGGINLLNTKDENLL